MKIMYSRARQLKIVVFFSSPSKSLRTIHHIEKDSGSRVKEVESGC